MRKKLHLLFSLFLMAWAPVFAENPVVIIQTGTTNKVEFTVNKSLTKGAPATDSLVYVDWGDGVKEEFNFVNKISKSKSFPQNTTVKIYGDKITYFECKDQNFESLEFTDATIVKTIYCTHSNLKSLILPSSNNTLSKLSCGYNQLTLLNASGCKSLMEIYCSNNKLTELKSGRVGEMFVLSMLDCSNNCFTFSTVPPMSWIYKPSSHIYMVNPQKPVAVTPDGNVVDLSVFGRVAYNIYVWKTTDGKTLVKNVDYQEKDGKFTFIKIPKAEVYCEMNYSVVNPVETYLNCALNLVTENIRVEGEGTPEYTVSLNKSSLKMPEGDMETLIATVSPDNSKPVYWRTSNPAVATVDQNGKVTATGFGSAIVTAKLQQDTTITDGCNVEITVNSQVYKDLITLETNTPDNVFFSCKVDADMGVYIDRTGKSETGKGLIKIYGKGVITEFSCQNQTVISADFSKCKSLKIIECQNLNLESLVLPTSNSVLTYLNCSSNRLTSLDASGCTNLVYVKCNSNYLTSFKTGTALMLDLQCAQNSFDFNSVLPKSTTVNNYVINPSRSIPVTVNNGVVDLSKYNGFNGIHYTWRGTDKIALSKGLDYMEENGVFTFLRTPATDVYCEFTCSKAPLGLVITTQSVKVTANETIIPKITLDKSDFELFVGDNYTLTATSSDPLKTITWKVGDTGIATVDQTGKVSAIKAGTTMVSARLTDLPGVEAVCTLKVKQVVLDKNLTTIKVGTTVQLTASVNPGNMTDDFVWSSGNTGVATVDNTGNVTAIAKGIVNITVGLKNNPSAPGALCKVEVTENGPVIPTGSSIALITNETNRIEFKCVGSSDVYVDWGDGVIEQYSNVSSSLVKQKNFAVNTTIKIYMDAITEFSCSNQNLYSVDFTKSNGIQIITCVNSNLEKLVLPASNASLRILDCFGNKLKTLDASGCGKLVSIRCNDNDLTQFVPGSTSLTVVNMENNRFTFSTILPRGKMADPSTAPYMIHYVVNPQKPVSVSATGNVVDLTSLGRVDLNKYIWKTSTGVPLLENIDYVSNNKGVFTFIKNPKSPVYCEILHITSISELVLKTEPITVTVASTPETPETPETPQTPETPETPNNEVVVVPETASGTAGKLDFQLAIPTKSVLTGSFKLILPEGMKVDLNETVLSKELADGLTLEITEEANNIWLFEIYQMLKSSKSEAPSYLSFIKIVYQISDDVKSGVYNIAISDVDLKLNNEGSIKHDNITTSVNINRAPTSMTDVQNDQVSIYLNNNILNINSPYNELISIYTLNGNHVYCSEKPEGLIQVNAEHYPGQVLIVKGSAGWIRKVVNK